MTIVSAQESANNQHNFIPYSSTKTSLAFISSVSSSEISQSGLMKTILSEQTCDPLCDRVPHLPKSRTSATRERGNLEDESDVVLSVHMDLFNKREKQQQQQVAVNVCNVINRKTQKILAVACSRITVSSSGMNSSFLVCP